MSMALNRMMIFAVIPAVLASPAPAKAQGQNSGVDLDRPEIVCAMAYEALGTMDWIQREIVNMDEIDTQFRSESLVRPLGPDYAAAAVAAGIHLRTALSSEEARTPAEIANFIGMLASCDNRFDFEPTARQRAAPQVTDRDCAAAFWLHAAYHPEQRQDALRGPTTRSTGIWRQAPMNSALRSSSNWRTKAMRGASASSRGRNRSTR